MNTLEIPTRSAWRSWLRKHHKSSDGIWLVFYKHGKKSIDYEDAVREALCFGWIDSLIKRLDDERYARKFTPRKPSSSWSDINRKRWAELEAAGKLTAAGRTAAPTSRRSEASIEIPLVIPAAFKKNAKAWAFFKKLAPSYQRLFLLWINMAKRPETRAKRIAESIEMLAAGKKLGLK